MSDVSPQLIDRLVAISRALAGHIDPGSAFRATAIEIGTLIPHDHIDLAVLSQDGRMHACYEAGFHTSWSDLAQHPVEGSPIRRVLWGQTPFLLSDNALVDERFHFAGAFDEPIFEARLRSRIIVPLRARGSVIGALNISRHEVGCYTLTDVAVAQQCADLIAPYIFALIQTEEARRAMLAESEARNRAELLRVGASQLTEGMERERRRMAMDLHDQTLADLARIARQVSAFRSRGMARTAQLADLEQEIAGCLAELRHIVDDMRPSVLELFGLRDAVEAHLNRSVARAKPPIAVRIADTSDGSADRLPETMRTSLYRIVQEAINNAVRHAAPGRIEVLLTSTDGVFKVVVTDDGHGCGTIDPAAQGGIGHMHTRAALVGARLRFEPAGRKGGTRVVIEIDRAPADGKPAMAASEPVSEVA
ncbi:MAG: ATPase [Mesorhizobium sp.]|nr:MAG: ATPase [Mesorhizobium sp.]